MTSMWRSPFLKCTIGMSWSSAKASTALRNRLPIFSITDGEGIVMPRWVRMKPTTWPEVCRFGT